MNHIRKDIFLISFLQKKSFFCKQVDLGLSNHTAIKHLVLVQYGFGRSCSRHVILVWQKNCVFPCQHFAGLIHFFYVMYAVQADMIGSHN